VNDPYAMATDLLARVAAYLDATDLDVPTSRYVAPGDSGTIAYDGPALMVTVDQVYEGQPGQDRSQQAVWPLLLHAARFSVTLLRSAATVDEQGNPPSPAAIQADAVLNIGDLWAIRLALVDVKNQSQKPGGWVDVSVPVVLGPVLPVGPMGAAVAAVGSIHASIF
jgi:uncharacterized membrane protein (DUF4010 family)